MLLYNTSAKLSKKPFQYHTGRLILGGIVLMTAFILSLSSCFDETFESNVDLQLLTSVDTLRFDTVFTTVGSVTRSVKIYNPSDQNINITSIKLVRGEQSMFRLNVDGIPGDESMEVPILARDSVYLFVEVTVDPDQPVSVSPFIINEEVLISSGNVEKVLTLEAWGQNANYFPSRDAQGQIIGLTCNNNNIVWDDPKPYVVYGLLFIDSCSLVIPAGTQVFVHGGLARQEDIVFNDGGLFFLPNGQLITQGTPEDPVVFQGDRLESGFQDAAGQWSGLRFLPESRDHRLAYTEIKNSIVGLRVDSAASVSLNGVQIYNTSNIGLLALQAEIQADNSLIHSNGPQSVAMIYGGEYRFRHCTIANYENQAPAVYMDNFTCLDAECTLVDVSGLKVDFQNSIIMGSNDDELDINDALEGSDPGLFQVTFNHTLIKVDESRLDFTEESCVMCLEHLDEPVFLDEINDVYRLDTMSLARDQGVPIPELQIDITGVMRDNETPDIGCFEFLE